MREMLFRGKHTDNGAWIEGSLIHCDLTNGGCYTAILEPDDSNSRPFEFPYLCCESGCIDGYACPVNPATVGQFTGLTDKNGKKIFEGDIIKSDNGKQSAISVVIFGEYYPKMFYKMLDTLCPGKIHIPAVGFYAISVDKNEEMILFQSRCVTVIGNIHDNPELLGGTENG